MTANFIFLQYSTCLMFTDIRQCDDNEFYFSSVQFSALYGIPLMFPDVRQCDDKEFYFSSVQFSALYGIPLMFPDVRQCDDMDISPGSTPTHSRGGSRPASCMGTPLGGSTSTPGSTVPTSTVTSAGMTSTVLGAVAALPRLLTIGLSENSAPAPAPKVDNNDLTQQGECCWAGLIYQPPES